MAQDTAKKIQSETNELLKKAKSEGITFGDIEILREVLRFHEYRYYVLSDPLVSDYEYDVLYKSLE
ncbi:MAG: hypothetical protein ICV79_23980, partial [Flavisolibacter sp.]|nr:hypothetical protein [Flavisolibacter sp.]